MKKTLITLIILFFASCMNYKDLVKKITPNEVDQFARNYITLVSSSEFLSCPQYHHESIKQQFTPEILNAIHQELIKEPHETVELIGNNIFTNNDATNYMLTYQIKTTSLWYIVYVGIQKNDSSQFITGFRVEPLTGSLEETNRLRFVGVPIQSYVALLVAIIVTAFMLIGATVAIRSKINRKILWAVISLVSIFKFQVIWSTGQVAYNLITIGILGFGFSQLNPYSPWVVTFPVPIGAIVFLAMRKRLMKKTMEISQNTTTPPAI